MIPTFFRTDFMNRIFERQLALRLKFEPLTKDSLSETMRAGCRVLYLDSDTVSDAGLVVENEHSQSEIIPFDELKGLLDHSSAPLTESSMMNSFLTSPELSPQRFRCLDLVIVGNPIDKALCEFLIKEVKVPYVVCLHLKSHNGYHQKLLNETFKEIFVQYLADELLSGKTVKEGVAIADSEAKSFLSRSFGSESADVIGEGAVLLCSETTECMDLEILFGPKATKLVEGDPEDISNPRSPTNLTKVFLPFIGRHKEMIEIMHALKENTFLKITGPQGSGKTRLVLETAYHLHTRNHYPQGIFYFPLKGVGKMSLDRMLNAALNHEGLGSSFMKNLHKMFNNKNMLIILDDFNALYKEADFPINILHMLKTCKIHTILIESSSTRESGLEAIIPENKRAEMEEMEKKVETEYIKKTISIQPLSDLEIAKIAIAYSQPEVQSKLDANSLAETKFIKMIRGCPAGLTSQFAAGKIKDRDIELRLVPYYSAYIDVEKRYLNKFNSNKPWILDTCHSDDVSISRHSSYFRTDTFKDPALLRKTSSQDYFTFDLMDAIRVVSDKTAYKEGDEQNDVSVDLSDGCSDVDTELLDTHYRPSEGDIPGGEQLQDPSNLSKQSSVRSQMKDSVGVILLAAPVEDSSHNEDMLIFKRRKSQKSSKQGSPKEPSSFLKMPEIKGSPLIRSRESMKGTPGLVYSPIVFRSPQATLQSKVSPSTRSRLQESMEIKTIKLGGVTLNMATKRMNS